MKSGSSPSKTEKPVAASQYSAAALAQVAAADELLETGRRESQLQHALAFAPRLILDTWRCVVAKGSNRGIVCENVIDSEFIDYRTECQPNRSAVCHYPYPRIFSVAVAIAPNSAGSAAGVPSTRNTVSEDSLRLSLTIETVIVLRDSPGAKVTNRLLSGV